jgi:hypothetical protein
MSIEDRPCEKLKHQASVLHLRNSAMDYGVKDLMEHVCMMAPNQIVLKV